MLIYEVMEQTSLTRKAIEYYTEQKLVNPQKNENGYRNYSQEDILLLQKISIYRKLGLSIDQIKQVITYGNSVLQKFCIQKELTVRQEKQKLKLLETLSQGKEESFLEVKKKLESLNQYTIITELLLDAFPGYYGQFVCLHFSQFLKEPIKTEEQKIAFHEIIEFLDQIPELTFPEELQEFLDIATQNFDVGHITQILEQTKQSIEHPEQFFEANRQNLEEYFAYRLSEEYQQSPAALLQKLLIEFNQTSGYYDKFLPAMKKLSPSYNEYVKQLEQANDIFLKQYPEAGFSL